MPVTKVLIDQEQASDFVSRIRDSQFQNIVGLILDGVVDFYGNNATLLESPFDLLFFVETMDTVIKDVTALLNGGKEIVYWFDDYPQPRPIDDPATDFGDTGIRSGQAFNYAATHSDRKMQAALLTLNSYADTRQRRYVKERKDGHVTYSR